MKILSLLIALLISHHRPELARLRRYDWLLAGSRRLAGTGPEWLPAAALALIAVAAGAIAEFVAWELARQLGQLVFGIAAVAYTLGPYNLDRDIVNAGDRTDLDRRQIALERLLLTESSSGVQAAAASLHAALARWFGVVFWFAVLGIPGCLLYRLAREAFHHTTLQQAERAWIGRLLGWLNWPVMLLLVAAIAMMTDYDRVKTVFGAREDRWQLPPALLDDLAQALCDSEADLARGLDDGRRLAWRALTLWLAVLSLMLLAGWLD